MHSTCETGSIERSGKRRVAKDFGEHSRAVLCFERTLQQRAIGSVDARCIRCNQERLALNADVHSFCPAGATVRSRRELNS